MIEVADNGNGVPAEDYQALTLKYHTSKISNFDDLSVSARTSRGTCAMMLRLLHLRACGLV